MRGLVLAGGLAAVLAAAGRADDTTYDLRGPAPVKGQVFVSKMKMRITGADATLKVAGQSVKMKMSMVVTGEEEQKVLAVDGRNVTKCRSEILKERAEVTAKLGGMEIPPKTESTELEGKVVISERVGEGKWKHSLVDAKPTDKQKKELDSRNGIENEDDLYPAVRVKVGHAWTVDAKALVKLFGNSFTDIKGELKQKFVKVEAVEGEECAVVESVGTVKGKMKDEDGEPTLDVEMDLKVTSWRSVKTGVELKGTFTGTIKLAGKQKVDDQAVDITLSGPLAGESSTRLKSDK